MKDICIRDIRTAHDLARISSILGAAGVGLEGGGMWEGVARYLVHDGSAARAALLAAGIAHVDVNNVLLLELDVDEPGALGRLMAELAADGADLVAQYSDHENRKVLVMRDSSPSIAAPS
ncbi:amino acid-binding protein [Zhihengliuella halotolerans]|uniref:ACT domain-containing protein n=1 Tax=Zhihengliuella halotolerans TaxID=370736 RepID=A0A4Q8ABP0_9MICC|nr:amino acid-binding protein [Zhihengliuella halotolerans]RZU60963.1 hypothetical protein EV380_0518 [Zhihengliuella halotolerans]